MKIKSKTKVIRLLCSTLFVLAGLISLVDVNESHAEQWQFHVAPYGWLAGLEGDVATLPPLPSVNVDFDFGDILEDLDGSIMLVGEARKGRWGFFADFEYVNTKSLGETPAGRLFSTIEVETETLLFTGAGFYRVIEDGQAFVDLMAGARIWSVETELTLNTGLLPARTADNDEAWTDPLIGAKGQMPFGESPLFISGHLLTGGFGLGSDHFFDVNLNLGYQWTQTVATIIGYRYMEVDYDEDGFLYDVSQYGPLIGLSFRF